MKITTIDIEPRFHPDPCTNCPTTPQLFRFDDDGVIEFYFGCPECGQRGEGHAMAEGALDYWNSGARFHGVTAITHVESNQPATVDVEYRRGFETGKLDQSQEVAEPTGADSLVVDPVAWRAGYLAGVDWQIAMERFVLSLNEAQCIDLLLILGIHQTREEDKGKPIEGFQEILLEHFNDMK